MKNIILLLQACIWIGFGILGKFFTSRHTELMQEILEPYFHEYMPLILGVAEVILGLLILSGKWIKQTTILQIVLIIGMNSLEATIAPDLLLFGQFNFLFAILYSLIIFYTNFYLLPKKKYHVGTVNIEPVYHESSL